MKLSVIISAYDGHPLTVIHVRECMNSSYMPDEIIVVNDGGDPCLKDMLKKLEMKTRVIYARINEDIPWNYTGARNLGVWLSRGEFISIEDNEHIPHKDYYKTAIKTLEENPAFGRNRTVKRYILPMEDALNKPSEEWKIVRGMGCHQDSAVIRRDVYLKVKGYDERFAGRYAWASTDWRRRLMRADIQTIDSGYQWVVLEGDSKTYEKRRSGINYHLARKQKEMQSPLGIINFTYVYEQL